MKEKLPIADCRMPIATQPGRAVSPLAAARRPRRTAHPAIFTIVNRKSKIENGFTLIEVMVVFVLLSLIVLTLMAVFNSTQTAFRASVTQAGVLESGRATMDLMTEDLRAMSPSHGASYSVVGAANFYVAVTNYASPPSPFIQPLVGSSPPQSRTNVLENFFILSRGNQNGVPTWYGVGYAVATNAPPGSLYSLYRFHAQTNIQTNPRSLFDAYAAAVNSGQWTNMSHLMDGVVALTVRAYDVNGGEMTTNIVTFPNGQNVTNQNVLYFPSGPPALGRIGFIMFSNTLPASVEIEMGVLEDRALQRAESLSGSFLAQSNYLAGSASQVHIFRQRVSISEVDPAAYQ